MDIREQMATEIAKTLLFNDHLTRATVEIERESIWLGNSLGSKGRWLEKARPIADQILAIKVEENRDCFLCKYEARGALERIMKKPTEMCDKCHGTGIIPGRTLKQVLGEL